MTMGNRIRPASFSLLPKHLPWTDEENEIEQLKYLNTNIAALVSMMGGMVPGVQQTTQPGTEQTAEEQPSGVPYVSAMGQAPITNYPLSLFLLADDNGVSTFGTTQTQLVDSTKNWAANLWHGALLYILINNVRYVTIISSNTYNTLSYAQIPVNTIPNNVAYAINAKNLFQLKLARSAQSGNKTMTGAYVAEYYNALTTAWLFGGATIDLTNMQGGDTIWIRLRTRNLSTGGLVTMSEIPYNGVQPTTKKEVHIGAFTNTFGVEVSMYQSAGPFRIIPCDFYDATV